MKQILVVSSGIVHPNLLCRRNLKKVLDDKTGYSFSYVTELDSLSSLPAGDFSAVILYFQRSRISEETLNALEDFVFNGGGLFAIHSASASFKQSDRYYNLIGGKFISHGPVREFEVKPERDAGGPYPGISKFKVTDELYIHKYKEDISVHFFTEVNQKKEPVVWTRELGRGKLAYLSLGHRSAVFKSPQVANIIYNSLDWIQGD